MKEIDQCINIHAQHGDYELRLKYKLKNYKNIDHSLFH